VRAFVNRTLDVFLNDNHNGHTRPEKKRLLKLLKANILDGVAMHQDIRAVPILEEWWNEHRDHLLPFDAIEDMMLG